MFIAFEGPDNVGKSTTANRLSHNNRAFYNATKQQHEINQAIAQAEGDDLPVTYDRIDWFSHMVYRLALPGHEWNDERPRTVFAMPDTHLVVKIHHPQFAELIEDELYESGKVAVVNPMYWYFGDFFRALNEQQNFALFKSVSIMEVINDPRHGTFQQSLKMFSSPISDQWEVQSQGRRVEDDDSLLDFLRYVEHVS